MEHGAWHMAHGALNVEPEKVADFGGGVRPFGNGKGERKEWERMSLLRRRGDLYQSTNVATCARGWLVSLDACDVLCWEIRGRASHIDDQKRKYATGGC